MLKSLIAAFLLTASAAASAGTIGYISLANSDANRVSGTGKSLNSQADADINALSRCNAKAPARDCRIVMTMAHENACMSLARDYNTGSLGYAGWQIPIPATQALAQATADRYALSYCSGNKPANGGCQIESQVCSRTYDF